MHLSPLIELIAERVVRNGDRFVAPRRDLATQNRALLAQWVAEHAADVQWVPPDGGVTAFVRFPHVGDGAEFCRRLATKHRVLLVPGECFGHPGFARLGFGGPQAQLAEALDRLAGHLGEAHG
nr:capreomycidine synthase [uncultured bacterium]